VKRLLGRKLNLLAVKKLRCGTCGAKRAGTPGAAMAKSHRVAAPLMPGDAQGGHFFSGFAFDAGRNQGMAIWNDYSIPDFLTGPAGALFGGEAGVP